MVLNLMSVGTVPVQYVVIIFFKLTQLRDSRYKHNLHKSLDLQTNFNLPYVATAISIDQSSIHQSINLILYNIKVESRSVILYTDKW